MEGLCGRAPLAPWTGFVDGNFPMNRLGGAGGRAMGGCDGFVMIRTHYIYHVLYFYLSFQKNSSPNITEELKKVQRDFLATTYHTVGLTYLLPPLSHDLKILLLLINS